MSGKSQLSNISSEYELIMVENPCRQLSKNNFKNELASSYYQYRTRNPNIDEPGSKSYFEKYQDCILRIEELEEQVKKQKNEILEKDILLEQNWVVLRLSFGLNFISPFTILIINTLIRRGIFG